MRDIALAGGMGAGKSTVAAHLVHAYGYEARKIAQPLYDIAERLWGEGAGKDRARLQDLGMKMREIDPDVWINCYINELPYGKTAYITAQRELKEAPAPPVVNDTLRFPNEYWALRTANFVTVRVLAPEAVRVDRLQKIGRIQDLDRLDHVSETALIGAKAETEGIKFDYELNNDTDTENMEREVRNLMSKLEEEE